MPKKKPKARPGRRPARGGRELTPKRALFVREYLVDLNAAAAAIRAGYSRRSAKEIGHELLTRAEVQDAIAKAQAARSSRLEVTADSVLRELALIGFSRITDYLSFGAGGVKLKASDEITPDAIAAIESIAERPQTENDSRTITFKLHGKLDALKQISQHLGIGNDKLEAKVTATVEAMLDRVGVRMIASGKSAAFDEFLDALEREQSALGLPALSASTESAPAAAPAAGGTEGGGEPGGNLH